MIKEFTATGNTIDDAIAEAKAQLSAPEDADISIEVLEMPQKKTFGLFGGSKAKVRAYYEVPDAPVKAPLEDKKPPVQRTERAPVQKSAPVQKAAPKETPKPVPAAKDSFEEKKIPAQSAEAADVKAEFKLLANEEVAPITDYLNNILKALGLEQASITAKASADELLLDIACEEDYGILIGRRGETLDSVQYLIRLVAGRAKPEFSRVTINVGNYREKRESNLRSLALKNASQVARYGRKVTLDPMNPYERRIIHTAVQEVKGVTSFSVGSDSERRVVIALQDGASPAGGRGGAYNNSRGGNRGGYNNNRDRGGSRNNYDNSNRPSYKKEPRADRAPAKDAEAVSLYGKIDPKK